MYLDIQNTITVIKPYQKIYSTVLKYKQCGPFGQGVLIYSICKL